MRIRISTFFLYVCVFFELFRVFFRMFSWCFNLFVIFLHTYIFSFLGEKGAAVATRENSTPSWVKAEKVDKVVDTTGAGD